MKLKKKFLPAFRGLFLVSRDRSFQIQFMFACLAIVVGLILHFTESQWQLILLMITLVLTTEIMNTAVEQICNFICPSHHEKIGLIKDLAAASVLCASLGALVVGLWIVISHLI